MSDAGTTRDLTGGDFYSLTGARPYYDRDGIQIFLGDCRDVLPTLGPQSLVRAVLTDPPYNARKNYGAGTNDAQPWPEWASWLDDRFDAWAEGWPDTFMFLSQTAYRAYVRHGRRDMTWSAIWHKPFANAVTALPFMPHWEHIAVWTECRKGSRGPAGTFKRDGDAGWGSDVITANIEIGATRSFAGGHPTPKPLRALRRLISQLDHEIYLDPFMGSGTTLRAAKDLGRRAIGIEIEERWCEVAARRLEQAVLDLSARDTEDVGEQMSLLAEVGS